MKRLLLLLLLFVASYSGYSQSYCTPSFYYAYYSCEYYGMYFTNVQIPGSAGTSISDASGCSSTASAGYVNATSSSCTMYLGFSYTITLTVGTSYNQNEEVWIDFNNDGTFQSTEALCGAPSGGVSGAHSYTLTIPSSVSTGSRRLRMLCSYAPCCPGTAYPSMDPCTSGYYYGEVRDYTINIATPPPSVTPSPTSLTFATTTTSTCSTPLSSALSGAYLTSGGGNITVTAPSGYSVCSTATGTYASSYVDTYTGTTYTGTVYCEFCPTSSTSYTGNIQITGGGLTSAQNIPVSGYGSSACAATPTAGTAAITPSTGSSTTSFTLSLSGTTLAGGLTYQWKQCATSGGTYTNITGATNPTYTFSGLTANTYYECAVTCPSYGTATSSYIMATWQLPAASCTPTGGYCYVSGLSGFYVNGASSTSISDGNSCSGAYQDRTSLSCTLYTGAIYVATVNMYTSYYQQNQECWIDFNGNGTFETTEYVGGGDFGAAGSYNVNLSIPSSAPTGVYRMRYVTSYGGCCPGTAYPSIDPCLSGYSYAEARDYTVTIANPPSCSGTPSTGTISSTSTIVASGGGFTLSLPSATVAAGLTYQWSTCSTSGGTYSNISGATNNTLTISSISTTEYYKCTITCTASSSSATSAYIGITYLSCLPVYYYPGACADAMNSLNLTGYSGTISDSYTPSCSGSSYGSVLSFNDRTGVTPITVQYGGTYSGYVGYTTTEYYAYKNQIWIDFNDNNIFESTEYVTAPFGGTSCGTYESTDAFTMTIPSGSATGTHRMRVRNAMGYGCSYSGNMDPCNYYDGGGSTYYYYGSTSDYMITVAAPPSCSGTPTAGTAASTATLVTSGTGFTLSLTGSTTAASLTYQWKSASSSGGTYSNISGATNATLTVSSISTSTWYECVVTCTVSSSSATSSNIGVTYMSCLPYYYYPGCNSEAMNSVYLVGSSGTLSDSYTPTSAGSSYGAILGFNDRTSVSPITVQLGGSYSGHVGYDYTNYYAYKNQIWIDFNDNNTFESTEYVTTPFGGTSCGVYESTDNFTMNIPTGVPTGTHRMRVRNAMGYGCSYSGNMDPCNYYDGGGSTYYYYGSTADYMITVAVPPPVATPTPTSLSFGSIGIGSCSSPSSFTFTASYLTPSSGNMTITAPSGYKVCSTSGGSYSTSYTIAYTGAAVSTTTVYVELCPSSSGTYTGNVAITGGGLSSAVNVAVSGTGTSTACSGTPTAGTAAISPSSGNSSTTFSLSLSGTTAATGLTYQWESSLTSGGTYSAITGATNASYSFSGLSTTTYYKCLVTCTASSGSAFSNAVSATFVLPTASCTPSTSGGCYVSGFGSVSLTGAASTSISDAASCTGSGYLNETSLSCTLYQSYSYTITTTPSTAAYGQNQETWIDFNGNGTFESSEAVGGNNSSSASSSTTYTIAIPSGVTNGTYRMRVLTTYYGYGYSYPTIDPCMSGYYYGEARDYTVTISTPPPAVVATPTSLNFGSISASTTSSPMSFSIVGSYLVPSSGTITVTAPTNYKVCSTSGGTYVSSYTISYTSATISATNVYVEFVAPGTSGAYTGNVAITGGGLSSAVNVAVTGNAATPCTGMPSAGTLSSSPAAGTTSTSFTLGMTGGSIGLGLTYQWQSSTSGTSGTFTNITGATNSTYSMSGLTVTVFYQCIVQCSYSGLSSTTNVVQVSVYCQPAPVYGDYTCSYRMYPNPVDLTGSTGSIADASGCSGSGFEDKTSYSCTLTAGSSYTMTLGDGGYYNLSSQVWIDFNNDGTFQTSESVGGVNDYYGSGHPVIAIPTSVTTGAHRMRIVTDYNYDGYSYPTMDPCMAGYNYGEARDYMVTIAPPPPVATATPNPVSFGPVLVSGHATLVDSLIGLYLTPASGNLTVTAPSGGTFMISLDGSTWVTSLTIAYGGGTLATTAIYVEFNPASATTYSANIGVTGGGLTSTYNIAVTGTGAGACSGTPTAGTTVISPTSGGATTAFTVSLSGTTVASGFTYQWQSSPDGTTYTAITGATNYTYSFTGITANEYFKCTVTCPSYSAATSTAAMATFVLPTPCTPSPSYVYCYVSGIGSFNLVGGSGSISDGASCSGSGYQDMTSLSCTLWKGYTYNVTVTPNSTAYGQNQQIWIDFNGDGTFQTTETVGGVDASSGASSTVIPISIPSTVSAGTFRMRYVTTYYGEGYDYPSINPCTPSYYYSDCRDYKIIITNPPPMVTPTPATLAFGTILPSSTSPTMSSAIVGSYLLASSGNITVTAPTNFQVSPDGSSWVTSYYVVSYTGAAYTGTVYAEFLPTAATSYSGNIAITGGGLSSASNIAVTGTGASACSGTPSSGTAVVSPTTGNLTTSFTLSLSGATVASALTYQWQSSPDGSTWSNMSGGTTSTFSFTGISANTYFQCIVACPGHGSTSTTSAISATFVIPTASCTPSTSGGCYVSGMSSFYLTGGSGSISDAASCTGSGYQSRTSLSCTLWKGFSYTVTESQSGGYYPQNMQLWIDFNGDGTFQTTESVGGYDGSTYSVSTYNITIAVPSTVAAGTYRMRNVMTYYGYGYDYPSIDPCMGGYSYGEARDYTIVITNPPPALTVSPTSLAFSPVLAGGTSTPLTTTATGLYLVGTSGNITVTAPSNFEVSPDGSTWGTSYVVTYSGAAYTGTVYAEFLPPSTGTYTGNIAITGGGLSSAVNIAVSGTGAGACSGTPSAGSASATPSTGAGATSFTLSLSGTTVASGMTYQWQSSPTGSGSWTSITGATNATYTFSGLFSTTYYQCIVTCTSTSGTSTSSTTHITFALPSASCTPNAIYAGYGYSYISGMSGFYLNGGSGSISDGSGAGSGGYYSSHTSLSCTLYQGFSYIATISSSSSSYGQNVQCWIDFNSDGVFQSTETVGGGDMSASSTITYTITIPSSAGVGVYRMRVITSYGGCCPGTAYPGMDPCMSSYYYAECRDYSVSITPPPPSLTVTPSSMAFGAVLTGGTSSSEASAAVGSYLVSATGNLTVTAPSNFKVSPDGSSWATSYVVSYTGSAYTGTVYGEFLPTSATSYSGNISITGGGLSAAVNIAVTGTGAGACSGTPSAGTAVISPTSGNSGTTFALSLSGTTVASGMSFQWYSSPSGAGGTFAAIPGATTPTYSYTGMTATTYFNCIVTCPTYSSSTSSNVSATFTLPTACTPSFTYASASCGTYNFNIDQFLVAGAGSTAINDISACNGSTDYEDLSSSVSCTLIAGSTYTATVGTGWRSSSSYSYDDNCQVWIDLNSNGTFETSESIGGLNNYQGDGHTFSMSIPSSGVHTGTYRMRLVSIYNYYGSYPSINPCATYYYGDARDYTVTVVVPVACSGSPSGGSTVASSTSICAGSTDNFSFTGSLGVTGLTYQWQSSSTGTGGSFTSITGATSSTYSAAVSSSTYYNCLLTCTSSSGTGTSSNQYVAANPAPGAITGGSTVCNGSTLALSNSLSGGTWSSSNTSIASVNSSTGVVTGLSLGSCTISYTTTGCSPATLSLSVNTTPGSISGTTGICAGGTSTLTDAAAGGTWSSSNTAVASVNSSTGLVSALGTGGSATITYNNGCGSPATFSWTTASTPSIITGPTSICVSSTGTFSDSISGGTWSNSPTTVGTINSSTGVFSSTSTVGTSIVTYTIGYCSASATATVGNTSPASISGTANVCNGASVTLADATSGGAWSSSNTSVASVNASTGVVTGVSSGTATITYSTGCGTAATTTATVHGSPVTISTSTVCSQGTLGLTAATGSGTYTYSWTGPHGYTSTVASPTISSASTSMAGIYSVTASQSGCVTSASIWASVDTTPAGTINATPSSICPGGTSTLSDALTPASGTANYTAIAIPYAPLSFSTVTAGPTGDNNNATVTIPFGFDFYGTTYTSVKISTNGYINFGSASTSTSVVGLPSASAPLGMIAPFWHDLNAASGNISYATSGTAPNRKFVVIFNSEGEHSGAGVNSGQIILYETSNIIDMFVSQANTAGTYSGVCGIQNISGSAGVAISGENNANYTINNTTAGTGWRFERPVYSYAWSPATDLSATTGSSPVSSGLTSSQTYTATAIDAYSGCTSGGSASGTVTVATPTTYTITGGNGCSSSGITIGLSGSQASTSYQLYLGASTSGTAVSGTGSAITFGTKTATGIYKIVATSAAGCTDTMAGADTISSSPTAYAETGGNGCSGTGVTIGLANSQSGYSYHLYNSSTLVSTMSGSGSSLTWGSITAAGTYSITATGSGGCTTAMTGTSVITASPTTYSITGGNGCSTPGVAMGLTGSQSSVSYQLYDGASVSGSAVSGTGSSITFGTKTAAGNYTVIASGTGGCSTTMSGADTLYVNPTSYTLTGGNGCSGVGVTIGLSNSQSGVSYQLMNGSSTVGGAMSGTGSSLTWGTITTAGTYTIIATGSGGCTTTMAGSSIITAAPTVYTVTGGNGCSASGVTLALSGSDAGVTYQAYNGASIYGSSSTGTGSSISFGTITTVGTYTVLASGAGGCTVAMSGSDTINSTPAITLGANPSVCQPTTSATISYSGASGSPTTYNIVYGASAITAGFTNVTGATLTGGIISLVIPSGAAGTFTGSLVVSNGYCTSSTYSFTVTVLAYPTATISSATAPCIGSTTNIVFTGTTGASISYSVNGGSPSTAVLTTGSYTITTSAVTTTQTYELLTAYNTVCTTVIDSTDTLAPLYMVWLGGTTGNETDWNTGSNWACGFVPTSSYDVFIPAGTTYSPEILTSASGSTRNLSIASGATLKIDAGAAANVTGTLINNGIVTGSGTLSMDGSSAQHLQGNGIIENLDLNNSAGATLDSANTQVVHNTFSVTSGTFYTNDSLVLGADSSITARVAPLPSTGSFINGNVKVMTYVGGGRRAYRFFSNPFQASIPLTQLETQNLYFGLTNGGIDITGAYGGVNGFTPTGTNNASCFRYNPLVSNSSNPADPGWIAFTSAYGTPDSNKFKQYMSIRLYFRGSKGEGLGLPPYTVIDPVVVGMWGPLNQGNQTVTLRKGTGLNQDYNMVGNPYPSCVDIGTVVYNAKAAGNIAGTGFYVFNPYLGTAGQFSVIPIGSGAPSPYYLQAQCGFQVRANTDGVVLNFAETNKSSTATTDLLRGLPEFVSLSIYDANYHMYDMSYVRFNDNATNAEDNDFDAGKPSNGAEDVYFYSLSSDNHKLSIDTRPYKAESAIPLGFHSDYAQEYIIKAESIAVPADGKVYLHDKLLKQYVLLQAGTEYRFTVTSDVNTQGENRFELSMQPTDVAAVQSAKGLQVVMTPNPATDEVKINFTNGKKDDVSVRVLDLSGVSVYNEKLGLMQNGSVSIPLSNFASGIYMVELTSGDQKVVQRLIKE